MKNVKTLMILSVSLILASCGKSGGKSSAITSSEQTTSEPTSSEIASSSSSEVMSQDTPTLETDPAKTEKIIDDGLKELAKILTIENAGKSSFTEKRKSSHSYSSEESSYYIGADTPFQREYDKMTTHFESQYGYNQQDQTGYYVNYDDSSYGKMELDSLTWVAKEGNAYKQYDTSYDEIYTVDEEYTINSLMEFASPCGFFISSYADFEYDQKSLGNYLVSDLKDFARSEFNEGCYGKFSASNSYAASSSKATDGTTTLIIESTITISYSAPKLPEVIDCHYLTDVKAVNKDALVLTYSSSGLKSLSTRTEYKYTTVDTNQYGRLEMTRNESDVVDAIVENKYEPLKELPDTTGYTDQGIMSSWISFQLPNGDDMASQGGTPGETTTLTNEDILGSDADAAGITCEVYEDRELTKKVDLANIKFKSYSVYYYIKVIVPKDVTYARYISFGQWPEDYGTTNFSSKLTKRGTYIGEPKDYFCMMAYTCSNVSDTYGSWYPSVTLAPVTAEVYYTTDESVTVKNKKYVDLKGGCFYCISYNSQIVA